MKKLLFYLAGLGLLMVLHSCAPAANPPGSDDPPALPDPKESPKK